MTVQTPTAPEVSAHGGAPTPEGVGAPESSSGGAASDRGLPFRAVLGLAAGLAVLANALTPLRDIDLYWHILAGRELLAGTRPDAVGATWTFANDGPWVTTQWLSEVLFAALHAWGGWAGLAAFRVVTAAVALAVLAHTTLRGRPAAVAGFPFLLAAVMVAYVSQDRPAQVSLIGAALLGGVLLRGLTGAPLPRWWLVVPLTTLWANLHGGWILVPLVLGLVTLSAALTQGLRTARTWRAAALTVAGGLAGWVTPAGWAGLTAIGRFSAAAAPIGEWERVEPLSRFGWVGVAMVGLLLLGWWRARPPVAEVLVALVLVAFGGLANRNLAPALVLLAPLVAHRLVLAFPGVGRPEPRWSTPAGVALAGSLTLVGLGLVATADNLPRATEPIALATRIADLPPGQRVLNDYNVAGIVLYFGGPGTQVAIDGRADRYGAATILAHGDLLEARGDWEARLAALAPTAALLSGDSRLAGLLPGLGWTQAGPTDDGFVLLLPPRPTAP